MQSSYCALSSFNASLKVGAGGGPGRSESFAIVMSFHGSPALDECLLCLPDVLKWNCEATDARDVGAKRRAQGSPAKPHHRHSHLRSPPNNPSITLTSRTGDPAWSAGNTLNMSAIEALYIFDEQKYVSHLPNSIVTNTTLVTLSSNTSTPAAHPRAAPSFRSTSRTPRRAPP